MNLDAIELASIASAFPHGKLVDGRVIFGYPLAAAQRDGYFKPIRFVSVFQVDPEQADVEMAEEALKALRADGKGRHTTVLPTVRSPD